MEIQVGEYIRTKIGTIGKIKRIDFDEIDKSLKWYIYNKKDYITGIAGERAINKPYIKSHSFNIAEILEEDDYVNGMRVSYVRFPNDPYEPAEIYVLDKHINFIFASDIKSVVTHEQMEAMEYEVK